MTRASKTAAKKTTAPASAPAKKTTAKRTPAKPRTPRTRKTTAALSLVKPPTKPATDDQATVVDLRYPLNPRRRLFVGPMGPNEQAAIRAALDSARLRLPIPVRTWNGSQAQLTDGTLLIHNPGPDRTFTAHIACRRGAIHGWPITSERDLRAARAITHACERRHSANTPAPDNNDIEHDWHKAISHGIRPTSRLAEGLATARKSTADTQPLSLDEIGAHIAEQLADADVPKEHPQP
ncbi:hypothetical protein [Streptomyces griseorubiginosus]|uniref:hypothetical protein n=1 Tax=Streptomyces griseorubiginosus TaxID=67304 RepID=UPI003323E8A4